jgi:hypothetical protein
MQHIQNINVQVSKLYNSHGIAQIMLKAELFFRKLPRKHFIFIFMRKN